MVVNLLGIADKSELRHYVLNLSKDLAHKESLLNVLDAIVKHNLDDLEIFRLIEYWFVSDVDIDVKYKTSFILATIFEEKARGLFEWGFLHFRTLQEIGALIHGISFSDELESALGSLATQKLSEFSRFLRIEIEDLKALLELDETIDHRLLFNVILRDDPSIPLERSNFILSRSLFRKKCLLNTWGQLVFILDGHVNTIKLDGWNLPESVPECISKFKNLHHLRLRGCQLKNIPSETWDLVA